MRTPLPHWLLLAILASTTAALADPPPLRPFAWAAETDGIRSLYLSGDFDAAQQAALHVFYGASDPHVRRDAATWQCLCLLRSAARSDRLDGRQRLMELASDAPLLLQDPECNLALGIAETALSETSSALDRLDRVVRALGELHQDDRRCAALAALAAAWAAHTEWELTSTRLVDIRPHDADEAERIRIAKIREIRAREFPDGSPASNASSACAAARDEIDLTLARRLLDGAATKTEGRDILVRLVEARPLRGAAVDAALELAPLLEQEGRGSDAIALYERVLADAPSAKAQVESRLAALRRPELTVDAPATSAVNTPLAVRIRARGLSKLELEIRAVDLDAWLSCPQGRGGENALLESGSVEAARKLNLDASTPNAAEIEPLAFAPPAGGHAIIARGTTRDGAPLVVKRLVIATDLVATCMLGGKSAAVWVTGRDGSPVRAAGSLKFWMYRSFVPTEAPLADGVALFDLPGEARLMRDRAWFCLVRVGEQVAYCHGDLRELPERSPPPIVEVVAGPPTVAPGEPFTIAGVARREPAPDAAQPLKIRFRAINAMNDEIALREADVQPSGLVTTEFQFDRALIGKLVRVTLHEDRRVVENSAGWLAVHVADNAFQRPLIEIDWPPVDVARIPPADVRAWRSWGATFEGQAAWNFVALPADVRTDASRRTPLCALDGTTRFSPTGGARIELDTATTKLDDAPADLRLMLTALGDDGSEGFAFAQHDRAAPANSPATSSAPSQTTDAAARMLRSASLTRDNGQAVAVVELAAPDSRPLLLVADDGEPIGASLVDARADRGVARIPLKRLGVASVQIHAVAATPTGAAIRESAAATPIADEQPAVRAAPDVSGAWPGSDISTTATLERVPPGSVVVARLIDALEAGLMRDAASPLLRPTRPRLSLAASEVPASAELDREVASELAEGADAWQDALCEGETLWCTGFETLGDTATFPLRLPETPGRFNLIVAVRTPEGRVAVSRSVIDTLGGLAATLSAPSNLLVGDRTWVALRLNNPTRVDLPIQLRLDVPVTLELRSCVGLDDGAWRSMRDDSAATRVVVPPGGRWMRFELVAAAPDDAPIRVEIGDDAHRRVIESTCVVRAAAAATSPESPLRVQRQFVLWTPPATGAGAPPKTAGKPHPLSEQLRERGWKSAPWQAGESLAVGQVLQVRDVFRVEGARPAMTWRQLVPATCDVWPAAPPEVEIAGELDPPRDQTIGIRVASLQPGEHVQEYFLILARPGDCALPPAELDLLGRPLSIEVRPADVRMAVTIPDRLLSREP